MKNSWRNTFFLAGLFFLSSCSVSKLYFVRHAEKSLEVKIDPPLTSEGEQRAEELARLLGNKKISSIYSTETKRTLQTGKPLAEKLGISIQPYAMDTMPKFLFRVLNQGQNTLIIGHSNTLIPMLEELELNPSLKEISDQEYDNLYIVILKPQNGRGGYKMQLKETKFGKAPPKSLAPTRSTMMDSR